MNKTKQPPKVAVPKMSSEARQFVDKGYKVLAQKLLDLLPAKKPK